MTASKDYTVECEEHGRQVAAVVCRHLINAKDRVVGFVENSDDPNDLQAWCDACEALFLQEGELTETFRAFCDMGVVCTDCYNTYKARHSKP
jgi:hypothetical protein